MQRVFLLTSLLGIFTCTAATAVTTPYACQFVASAGLTYENSSWRKTGFNLNEKFILVLKDGVLTSDSAAKPMRANSFGVECRQINEARISCSDTYGGYLLFAPQSGEGGVAQLLGAAHQAGDVARDDLVVKAFTCSKY